MAQDIEIIEPLTERDEKFVDYILSGMPQWQAYKLAWGSETDNYNTLSVQASKLRSSPKISIRLKEVDEEAKERSVLTRVEYIQKALRAHDSAILDKQYGPAVGALKVAGTAAGVAGEQVYRHAHIHANMSLEELNEQLEQIQDREKAIGLEEIK